MKRKKLSVILNGGLGNQLFIYAATLNFLSINRNYKIEFIPSSGYTRSVKDITFYINKVKLKKKLKSKFLNSIIIYFKKKISSKIITETSILRKYNFSRIMINGYFQNEKWYKNSLEKVATEICNKEFFKKIKKIKIYDLAISLRGTDYIDLGMCLRFEYYFQSLKKLNIKKNEIIKIISDDLDLAKKFTKELKIKGYKVYENKKDLNSKSLNDFLVLIKSKKLIMSNSSFCWWAAILRLKLKHNPNYVVCPKFWYPNNKNILKNIPNNHPGNPHKWKMQKSSFMI